MQILLRDSIQNAEENGHAIGHFNCAELTVFNAAVRAAKEARALIIIGMSEKEREFFGKDMIRSMIRSSQDLWSCEDQKIFFNADHTKSFEKVREAVEAGFESIMFDASHLPLEENIRRTREVVRYIQVVCASGCRDILVEGEVGYIGEGSKMRTQIPKGVRKVTVAEAVRFVEETGVDMLAPAVGNIHGIIISGEPKLDIKLIKKIKEAVQIPLVLHGASGNSDREIRAAIKAGISIVHISTEIRVAWRDALRASLNASPDEVAPYNLLGASEQAAEKIIRQKLSLFGYR